MYHHNKNKPCSVTGCGNGHSRHGFCEMHAKRWMRHGDPHYAKKTVYDRFIEKIEYDDKTDCWVWIGDRSRHGYGFMATKVPPEKKMAHRVGYELFIEHIPEGMLACHSCDNPTCVNPFHIFTGDQFENLRDMMIKGRRPCKLTEENVREIREAFASSKSRLNGLSKMFSEKFGVSTMTIQYARDRRTWNHI